MRGIGGGGDGVGEREKKEKWDNKTLLNRILVYLLFISINSLNKRHISKNYENTQLGSTSEIRNFKINFRLKLNS